MLVAVIGLSLLAVVLMTSSDDDEDSPTEGAGALFAWFFAPPPRDYDAQQMHHQERRDFAGSLLEREQDARDVVSLFRGLLAIGHEFEAPAPRP